MPASQLLRDDDADSGGAGSEELDSNRWNLGTGEEEINKRRNSQNENENENMNMCCRHGQMW